MKENGQETVECPWKRNESSSQVKGVHMGAFYQLAYKFCDFGVRVPILQMCQATGLMWML